MAQYIFVVNLHTEDPSPSYQILDDENDFLFPTNKIPKALKKNDTIKFKFIGRKPWDCELYVSPMSKLDEEKKPFKELLKNGVIRKTNSWNIPLYKRGSTHGIRGVKIIRKIGFWDFTIAGTFKLKPARNKHQMALQLKPFLVDPEVVVGERD